MQNTLKEIEQTKKSRLEDIKRLRKGIVEDSNINYFLERERNRTSKENLHLLLLKKNKFFSSSLKAHILTFTIKTIHQFYPSTDILTLLVPSTADVGIQNFYDVLIKFLQIAKINYNEKLNSILRPNNPIIIADTLFLVIEQTKNLLKKLLYQTFYEKGLKRDFSFKNIGNMQKNHRPFLKEKKIANIERIHTEDITLKKQQLVKEYAVNFQNEHQQYLRRKRQQFVQNFDQQYLTKKFNNDYVELVKLNMNNKARIKSYYEKFVGKKILKLSMKNHGTLYTNEEKQKIIGQMEQNLKRQEKHLQRNYVPSFKKQNRFKDHIKHYIKSIITIYQLKNNLSILKDEQIPKINDWLPFGVYSEDTDEFSFCILFDEEDIHKSSKTFKKAQSVVGVLNNKLNELKDIRKTDNVRYGQEARVFKKQIVFCFNRKKIKELLEYPRVSPGRKKQTNSSAILLPNINPKIQKSNIHEVRNSFKERKSDKKNRQSIKNESKNQTIEKESRSKIIPNLSFNFINL